MKKIFSPSQFAPTEWDSSDDKAWFANYFVYFVESEFRRSLFTKQFYRRVSMCFAHIAHYDLHGFYATWFQTAQSKVDFLKHTLTHRPCGDPAYAYSDVEWAIQKYLVQTPLLQAYEQQLHHETEKQERALLSALKQKYESSTPALQAAESNHELVTSTTDLAPTEQLGLF